MNNVEMNLTIKMSDSCENTMSLTEAKALYQALDGLFGNSGVLVQNDSAKYSAQKVNTEPVVNEKHTAKAEASSSPRVINDPLNTENRNKYEETMPPPPNLKVEAARKRAAERTSGCGNRNK